MSSRIFAMTVCSGLALSALPHDGQAVALPNLSVPGVAAPWFQNYLEIGDVAIVLRKNDSGVGFKLTADSNPVLFSQSFEFWADAGTGYQVINGLTHLEAEFNDPVGAELPVLTGGSLSISGSLSPLGVVEAGPAATLHVAALTSVFGADTNDDATPKSMGFKLTGGPSESIYLYGFNVDGLIGSFYDPDFVAVGFRGNQTTTTTIIPVPAAAWLFGSAFTLLWRSRKRT